MNDIIQLFSAYAIVLLWNENALVFVDAHKCNISTLEGLKFANCSGKYMVVYGESFTLPDDLESDIQYLDLSFFAFTSLTDTTFQKFTNLIRLIMHKISVKNFVPNYVFQPLTKLEDMELTNFFKPLGSAPVFFWPSSIKRLNVSNSELIDLNAEGLTKLEIADVSHNVMYEFPHFSVKAPLLAVILDGNHMDALTVNHLAPFCHITTLSMKFAPESAIYTSAKYCDCVRLNIWTNEFGITADTLGCNSQPNEICNKEFGEELLSQRRACLGERTKSYTFVLIFAIAFLLILTVVMLIYAYRYVNLRRHVAPEEPVQTSADEDTDGGETGVETGGETVETIVEEEGTIE